MPPAEPLSQTLRVHDFPLHYWEWAPAPERGGDLVVLLHGFLDHGRSFGALMSEARASEGVLSQVRVVAPDARGHGRSGRVGPGGYYYFPDYIADLRRLIQALAPERVAIVGHSMGGSIAWMYAGSWPQDVAALVLLEGIGPPDSDPEDSPEIISSWVRQVDRVLTNPPKPLESIEAAAERLRLYNPALSEGQARDLAEHGVREVEGGYAWNFDPLHRTRSPFPFSVARGRAFWKRVSAPTLIVDGGESQFVLDDAAERRACFQRHQHQVVPGAGHMLQHDQPAVLAKLLDAFLKTYFSA